jgi:hypothetical protein
VDELTAQIKSRPAGQKIVLKRSPASSHCVRPHDHKSGCLQLDFAAFNQPISVETVDAADLPAHCRKHFPAEARCVVARVQALMSMEQLVDTLLPHGYVLAVVPEFKGITVGAKLLMSTPSPSPLERRCDSTTRSRCCWMNFTRVEAGKRCVIRRSKRLTRCTIGKMDCFREEGLAREKFRSGAPETSDRVLRASV